MMLRGLGAEYGAYSMCHAIAACPYQSCVIIGSAWCAQRGRGESRRQSSLTTAGLGFHGHFELNLASILCESHGWTQVTAAKKIGIPQPIVSNIMSGNTSRLTVDYLIDLLDRLNIPWSARRWGNADDACAGYGRNEALAWLGFRPCSVIAQNPPLSSRSDAVNLR